MVTDNNLFTEEEMAYAKKKCDEIAKQYGLDKIDKNITASISPKEAELISRFADRDSKLKELGDETLIEDINEYTKLLLEK